MGVKHGFSRCLLLTALGLLGTSLVWAESQVLTLEGTRIRGDQESPTVLYLVPWQPPEAQRLRQTDGELLVESRIEPLERAEFQRMVGYHARFKEEVGLQADGATEREERLEMD